MASMNYVSASDVGGKMKTAGAVKASIRHDDKDERIKTQTHKNEFIDKTLTSFNVDFLGLSYKEKCARFDDRIKELDETTNTNKRKDRVLAFGLHTTIPDTLPLYKQIQFAQDIVGLYADKYGRENIISADFHQDEGHDYVDSRTHTVVHSLNGLHMTIIPEIDGRLNGKAFSSKAAIKEMNREIDTLAREKYNIPYLKSEEHQNSFQSVEELQRMSDTFCQEREAQLEDIEKDVQMTRTELEGLNAEADKAQKTIDEAKTIEAISQDVIEGNIGHNVGLGTVISKDEMQDIKKALGVSASLTDKAREIDEASSDIKKRNKALSSRESRLSKQERDLRERENGIEDEVRQNVEAGLQTAVERLQGLMTDICAIFKGEPLIRRNFLLGKERLDYIEAEYGEDFPELTQACVTAAKTLDEGQNVSEYADIGKAVTELPEATRNSVKNAIASQNKKAAEELDSMTRSRDRGHSR